MKHHNLFGGPVVLASLLVLISGCSGDGRPLEEAVEINDLDLRSIVVRQPASFLSSLVVNTGEPVAFSVEGINQSSELVELSSEQRRWTVLDSAAAAEGISTTSSIAQIDENGNFVATAQGDAIVRIQIGGLAANFPVSVANETLVSITNIIGADSIERCIPEDYNAIGTFSLGSDRALPNVGWRIIETALGTVGESDDDGAVELIGRNVGSMQLVAQQGTVSATKSIVIEDTLLGIEIDPETISLEEDDTEALAATGVYLFGETQRRVAITENVFWEVPENNGVVTVSNVSPDIGVLSSDEVGSTRVAAVCGDVREERALVVIDSDS